MIKVISIVLKGGDFNRSLFTSLHQIFTNIVQLIRFNSIKRKGRKKIQNFCHSTKIEPPPFAGTGWAKVHVKTGNSSLMGSLADEGMSIRYN